MNIGVSGSKGSFSEQAAEQWIKNNGLTGANIVYLVSFEPLFDALDAGSIDLGIFPVFNSTMGLVKPAMHALAHHHAEIEGFFDVDVVQCLLSLPGVTKDQINTIVSQQPALDQCPEYISREFPNAKIVPSEDTAKAAADVAAGKYSKTTAAIGPKSCARLYGLELLEEGVQDLKHNYTSFLAVTKGGK
jgi:prephenate dehydratase